MRMRHFAGSAAIAVLALAAAPAAFAQATTGGVAGRVVNDAGQPVAGATVVITHLPTNSSTTTVTDSQGNYVVLNQRVGGPYTVSVTAQGFTQETVDIATIGIGEPTSADVTVHAASAVKEVTITGTRAKGLTAPRTRVSTQEIVTLPSQGRDLKDFARKSPYVVLDPTNSNALIINGQNNRSNSITIDGIKQTDTFGLNGNGYPTQRTPISLSVVQSLQVEVSPFDVIYGDFQGGTVNVVTKSGSNDFHGEAFYEYDNNHLRGSSFFAPGATTPTPVKSGFSEKTWGVFLSGPIWKDHAFFVLDYENFVGTTPVTTGPTGSGQPTQVLGVQQSDVDAVTAIMKSVYHYDPLGWQTASIPIHDRKFFAKLDWNISDQHRAVFEYQKTDGGAFNTTGSGSNGCGATSASTPCLSLLSKDYTLQTNLSIYKGQLFSHWTDAFTTEVSYSHQEADNISTPTTKPFAEFQVFLPTTKFNANGTAICTAASPCPSIVLGTDISRQANALTDKIDQLRLKGDYRWNGHTFTAGYELQMIDVYNLFIQRAIGQYQFNCETTTACNDTTYMSNLAGQIAYRVAYANTADNATNDGAASFKYDQHTLYLQDEWAVLPNLTIRAGVRDDFYTSGDKPRLNPAFFAAYGYNNNKNLDGMGVIQPRVGFNWRPLSKTTVYGGYGLFEGGSPLVWISNSYSNPGNLLGTVVCTQLNWSAATGCPGNPGDTNPLVGVTGGAPGKAVLDQNTNSANLGTGSANGIAPGVQPVSIWKATIGVRRDFDLNFIRLGDNWHASAEYVDSEVNKALYWQDVYMQKFLNATAAPDGRPTFGSTLAGGATLYGSNARLNRTDVVLFNTNQGFSDQWTLALGKEWRDGPLQGLSIDASYTNTIAKDVNPGTSSVATSNYRQVAFANPNNPGLGTSNYEIRNLSKFVIEYDHKWFGDLMTRVGLYAQNRSGFPFSYTFNDNSNSSNGAASGMFGYNSLITGSGTELLYVPKVDPATHLVTATSDPLVSFSSAFLDTSNTANFVKYNGVSMPQIQAFNQFLKDTGLIKDAGRIAPRNGFRSRDVTTVDFHFGQEFPAFIPNGSKLEAYMDILNLGNMINNHWGVLQQASFPYALAPITAQNCQAGFSPATGTGSCLKGNGNFYQYNSFVQKSESANFSSQSTWQIKIGFRYKF